LASSLPTAVIAGGAKRFRRFSPSPAKRWNGLNFYVKPPDGAWRKGAKLVNKDPHMPGYAAFHGGLAIGPDGTIHTVIDFYEGKGIYDRRGLHQAVCYMISHDGGRTWKKADDTSVEVPARPPQMDVIARERARRRHEDMLPPLILAQGAIVLDGWQRPHVLYIDHRRGPGQLMHATADANGQWSRTPVVAINSAFPDHRPTTIRGSLSIRPDGMMVALLQLIPVGEEWQNGLPTRGMYSGRHADRRQ
jgi:hypothetical protein